MLLLGRAFWLLHTSLLEAALVLCIHMLNSGPQDLVAVQMGELSGIIH